MRKRLYLWLLVIAVMASAAGCGAKSASTSAAADQAVSGEYGGTANDRQNGRGGDEAKASKAQAAAPSTTAAAGEEAAVNRENTSLVTVNTDVTQKIIFSGQIDFQTLDFEKTRTDLNTYMSSIGAYIQNSYVEGGGIGYNRLKNAVYVFRIPKSKYNKAFTDMKKFGTVVFEQSNGEDVTDRYFDTEARLKSLKIQQERLLALLDKATKMEDILKIEKELQTTLYEIENLTGTLKKWDSLVDYSTLTVNIKEVEQIKPVIPTEKDGLFKRIVSGFKNSVAGLWDFTQNLLIFIASALPVLLPLGVIAYIVYRILRKKFKKNIKKSDGRSQSSEVNDSKDNASNGKE